jgi:hypothetical protein
MKGEVAQKKRLTPSEEFDIMKLVLDKFLWIGIAIIAFGLYKSFTEGLTSGIVWMLTGIVVLVLFMVMIVREYEVISQ